MAFRQTMTSTAPELAEQLFAEIKIARDNSPLPDGPDREGANKLLVELMGNHFRR
jgi:hypothetical protein